MTEAAPTDKERLDFLQRLNDRAAFTGRCVLRESPNGRGWRLHETSLENAYQSVRDAIDIAMKREETLR